MAMQSLNLLPELQKLPGPESDQRKSFRDIMTDLLSMDRGLYAAEVTAATSFAMWGIFDTVNVDDKLAQAYKMQYPRESDQHSLYEKWQQISEDSQESMTGFISGLKGKVAEINYKESLEAQGYTNVNIPDDPTHPDWDISAIKPDGEPILWQVKTGNKDYAGDVQQIMQTNPNPDISYAVSTEIYDKISERGPELIDKMTYIGYDYELVNGINDGLETLSANQGFDLPDSVGEMVPYAGAIIMGARLIYNVIKTEKEFSTADRTTKNKMQVVQALTTMSRFGISTVLSTAGGFGGAAVGSFVPGIGNLIGGIVGMGAGVGMGMYLNKHLQPHMLNLALDITGLTHDDLFYYKNKPHIDSVALSFRQNAGLLTAAS